MKKKIYLLTIVSVVFLFQSCKKDWLEAKRDLNLLVPTTLKDLQLLLNQDQLLNYDARGITEVSNDDIVLTQALYDGLVLQPERKAFIWSKDIYGGETVVREWNTAYQQILYTNVVLEALTKISRDQYNESEFDAIKGAALYFRSRAFLNLVMTYSNTYIESSAATDAGIPLKLSADINEKIVRASVKEVYDRAIADLLVATELLPKVARVKTDASKAAAWGLLARCYLSMNKYEDALSAANSCYSINNLLIDFNSLNLNLAFPIPNFNDEMHTFGTLFAPYQTYRSGNIEPSLYELYEENDLRKVVYFTKRSDQSIGLRGNYTGAATLFGSTATDEILLIRAECKVRLNDVPGGMTDLNTLLVKRFISGKYISPNITDKEQALKFVLSERRKELTRRGIRWSDLKRLNRDPRFAITLTRNLNGTTYTLLPNDPRYIMPIPDYIVNQSGIAQNQR